MAVTSFVYWGDTFYLHHEATISTGRDGQDKQYLLGSGACTHQCGIRGTFFPAWWGFYTFKGQGPGTVSLMIISPLPNKGYGTCGVNNFVSGSKATEWCDLWERNALIPLTVKESGFCACKCMLDSGFSKSGLYSKGEHRRPFLSFLLEEFMSSID